MVGRPLSPGPCGSLRSQPPSGRSASPGEPPRRQIHASVSTPVLGPGRLPSPGPCASLLDVPRQDLADGLSLPPFFYEADPDDPMDVALLQELVALNLEVSARLNIRRLRPGEYEIEGLRASLFWQTAELFVRARPAKSERKRRRRPSGRDAEQGDEDGDGHGEVPLASYLRQLANVGTRRAVSDHVDALAAAAAFEGITGGAGVGSAGSLRPLMGSGSSGMYSPVAGPSAPMSPLGRGSGLAGQAMAALAGFAEGGGGVSPPGSCYVGRASLPGGTFEPLVGRGASGVWAVPSSASHFDACCPGVRAPAVASGSGVWSPYPSAPPGSGRSVEAPAYVAAYGA